MQNRIVFGVSVLLSVAIGSARADEVTVKSHTLSGHVAGLTPVVIDETTTLPGLAFETDYGKGAVLIPFADMESLDTKGQYHVLYGDDDEVTGRLVGVSEGNLLIGESTSTAKPIAIAGIHSVIAKDKFEGSFLADLKSRYRYWTASADVGFSLTKSTTDQRSFAANLKADRRKAPTRFLSYLGGRYGTQSRRGGTSNHTDDLLRGGLKLEYDLSDRVFLFGQGDGTYDGIQKLSFRGVPQTGAGYRFYKTPAAFFQGQVGGAWVYESYFTSTCAGQSSNCKTSKDNFSIAFGLEAGAKLPYGSVFSWTADYLPAVEDFANDYLLRSEASLLVPVYDFVSVKLALADEYDSTPGQGTTPNRFTTTAGVAFVF